MTAWGFRAAPRVGFVAACPLPAPRGSQVLIEEMALAFHRAGAETHLVGPVDPHAGRRPYRVHSTAVGAVVPRGPEAGTLGRMVRGLFDLRLGARLVSVARRERLEVVHAHGYEGLVAALAARRQRRLPVVYHGHAALADELPLYVSGAARRVARRLGTWFDGALPRRAEHVVALSEDVRAYFVGNGVRSDRISVIPPGLDPTPFAIQPRRDRVASRCVVFAGNLDGYQNLDLLLGAWEILAGSERGVHLALVTHAAAGPLVARLGRRGMADSVRVVGAASVADVARELSRAAVGVSPRTSWSGFPIKTLNYMASGLPTVAVAASAKGVLDRETGWVVSEPSPGAFAAVLRRSLGDPAACARRGWAARALLCDAHAWERLAPRLLHVSRQACEGQRV